MSRTDTQLKNGFEQLSKNNFKGSIAIAKIILERRHNIDALVLAGISFFKIKDFQQAETYLTKAFNENTKNRVISVFLLETLLNLNKIEKGLSCLKKISIKDNDIINLEIQFWEKQGNYNQAIRSAASLKGLAKYEVLAWNHEQINQLKQAKKYAQKGLKNDENNFKCNVVLVKVNLRRQHYKKAAYFLKKIKKKNISQINRSIYYSIKAQYLEKLEQYDKAFKYYTKSNNALKQSRTFENLQGQSYYTIDKIDTIEDYFSKQPIFKNSINCDVPIVFMLGFPRSGTTLLENILNTHSEIDSIEEKPTVDIILQRFLNLPRSIDQLCTISESEIKVLQKDYIECRKVYCKQDVPIIIDKMPLNIIHIGILYRIFPNAKFILSTRDIRDVALSCFFQNFAINDAMAYFLDWESTNNYLSRIMQLGLSIIKSYEVDIITVEYEKLVEKPFEEVKKVVEFLGLEWQENIVEYRNKIKGININTPSYARVSEKIDSKQKHKWKNYIRYIN